MFISWHNLLVAMKIWLNFVYCVVVNEVFACVAAASSLLSPAAGGAAEGTHLCVLAATAVVIQALVFLHASGQFSLVKQKC